MRSLPFTACPDTYWRLPVVSIMITASEMVMREDPPRQHAAPTYVCGVHNKTLSNVRY